MKTIGIISCIVLSLILLDCSGGHSFFKKPAPANTGGSSTAKPASIIDSSRANPSAADTSRNR